MSINYLRVNDSANLPAFDERTAGIGMNPLWKCWFTRSQTSFKLIPLSMQSDKWFGSSDW